MKLFKFVIFLALISDLFFSSPLQADEVYTFVVKKQEAKKNSRWNLSDWLITRDSMRLQDLWLSLHTPVPYEFYLGGDYRFVSSVNGERDYRMTFAAYAKIFGLSVEKESEPSRYNLLFNLRIFGLHNQSTNITLHGGIRSQKEPSEFRSAVAGASLTLYLSKYFGLEGVLRHYFKATPSTSGQTFSGNQTEANAFIDFSFLRVYGGVLKQPMDSNRELGYHLGTRLFF